MISPACSAGVHFDSYFRSSLIRNHQTNTLSFGPTFAMFVLHSFNLVLVDDNSKHLGPVSVNEKSSHFS